MPVKSIDGYLADCLSSIVSQSFKDWELIIVNDHSTDNTSNIINHFALKDSRIRQYQNVGTGIIKALQLALSKTIGEYINRFDGDDIMPANRLALMVEVISKTHPKTVVTGKVKYFGNQPVSKGYQAYEQWLNERIEKNDHWDWVYRECVIASPNWMVRKDDLLEIGGFNQLSYPEDYDLVLKWHQHGFKILSLPETTLQWREHPERTSRNSDHYSQLYFFRLKVRHFIKYELGNSNLVLWGTDKKGKLTKSILDELNIPFTWMDMSEPGKNKKVDGQIILNYRSIEEKSNYKLLISVFPSNDQQIELEGYLDNLNLYKGSDYWYL